MQEKQSLQFVYILSATTVAIWLSWAQCPAERV